MNIARIKNITSRKIDEKTYEWVLYNYYNLIIDYCIARRIRGNSIAH